MVFGKSKRQIEELHNECKALTEKNDFLIRELATYKGLVEELKQKVACIPKGIKEKNLEEQEDSNMVLLQINEQLKTELQESQEENNEYEKALTECKQQLHELQKNMSFEENRIIQELKEKIAVIQREKDSLCEENKSLKRKLAENENHETRKKIEYAKLTNILWQIASKGMNSDTSMLNKPLNTLQSSLVNENARGRQLSYGKLVAINNEEQIQKEIVLEFYNLHGDDSFLEQYLLELQKELKKAGYSLSLDIIKSLLRAVRTENGIVDNKDRADHNHYSLPRTQSFSSVNSYGMHTYVPTGRVEYVSGHYRRRNGQLEYVRGHTRRK